METSNYPEIDEVLGNILRDGESPQNNHKGPVTDDNNPEKQSSQEITSGRQMTESAKLLMDSIRRLPVACQDTSIFKVRIYSEIMAALQSCDFGTTSMAKIINAILLDFIERNCEILRRCRRRSIIDR